MSCDPAPFFADLAEGPQGGYAVWVRAADGVRIRVVLWPGGKKGTVIVHPGRTEFAEKYGRIAADLARRGFSTAVIDWRGQGLADRVHEDSSLGHVGGFQDYQLDADAALDAVRRDGLPEPLFLIGHSMGGAIGLRSLMRPNPFRAAAFSAPMWGIQMSAAVRPVAWALPRMARALGQGEIYAPGTQRDSYLASAPFEDNTLTTDPEQFAYMQGQVRYDSRFALGGPSIHWLHEALEEIRALRQGPFPKTPSIAAVGADETVVDFKEIAALANRWPECRLEVYPRARHELLMERDDVRRSLLTTACDLFDDQRELVA